MIIIPLGSFDNPYHALILVCIRLYLYLFCNIRKYLFPQEAIFSIILKKKRVSYLNAVKILGYLI